MFAQRTACVALICVLSAGLAATARGSEGPGCTDADGCTICDRHDCDVGKGGACAGLQDGAFGLCNAFCNAQQCQLVWKHSCDELRKNFEKKTGFATFPCEGAGALPSATHTPVSSATPTATPPFATATATATSATATATRTGLATPTRTATSSGSGEFCAGLAGATFGLCNAFCNAQACHLHPDHPSCDELRRNFERHTGSAVFPCEAALTRTPGAGEGTPTRTPGVRCMCDCDGDGRVSIADLTRAVRKALGLGSPSGCAGLPGRAVNIQDLVVGVGNALHGCR